MAAPRIGTIAGPTDMTASEDRLAGWRQAMVLAGLADDAVEQTTSPRRSGERAAQVLMAPTPRPRRTRGGLRPDGRGRLRVLDRDGRRVPDDIAVVGYDDLGVAERTTPPLTTVRQPVEEMAEA